MSMLPLRAVRLFGWPNADRALRRKADLPKNNLPRAEQGKRLPKTVSHAIYCVSFAEAQN
jgi:hypothetical protein